ncbi:hypothetical protein GCM10009839_47980 [Catenulispora yoronensis]|uniref:ABC transporter domain-containing protein n=1 Tax=Catenulispora yoronensis TaxID=450799 RepID=A0ABN2UP66_9ACTN
MTETTPPVLEARGLGKRYRTRRALADCTLTVPPGRVVGLVGPNGAGKSTLLNLAVGLLRPTEGRISVFGAPPAATPAQMARVGFVAQDAPVYANLTVADHLQLGARLNPGWDAAFASARIAAAGLPMKAKARTLSGGQRAQLALTVAVAKRPSLLILDEPVAALDPLARREFLDSLAEAVAGGGVDGAGGGAEGAGGGANGHGGSGDGPGSDAEGAGGGAGGAVGHAEGAGGRANGHGSGADGTGGGADGAVDHAEGAGGRANVSGGGADGAGADRHADGAGGRANDYGGGAGVGQVGRSQVGCSQVGSSQVGGAGTTRMTVVLSSHLVSDLERVCDHLIILTAARIQAAGAVTELLAAHRAVAGPAATVEDMVLAALAEGGAR